MTRVLLTGAGGFAGAHILAHLLTETGWEITATDSFRHRGKSDRIRQTLAGGPPDWQDRTTVITHDLTAPLTAQFTAAAGGPPDYILAVASQSHVDRSIADPLPFVRNNTDVALSTLEYARQVRPRAVILLSTDEVYGPVGRGSRGHDEWAPVLPSNPYAASKAAQEALAVAWWRTYAVPVVIVNAMNMIGEMQDPEKYLPMLISRVAAGREVTVHGNAQDIGTRHYLHARNVADAMLFILRSLPPAAHGRPYVFGPDRWHVAGLGKLSNLDLAEQVAALVGKPLRYRLVDFHTTRPGHDPHYGLDSRKITAAGWKAPVPFAESLARTVAWTLAHPEWMLP